MTSDNPRNEDPARIIEEIKTGLLQPSERSDSPETSGRGEARTEGVPGYIALVDRRAAIEKAIELAQPGDLVLIAGKGHEKYQVIGERVLPFDDVAVARDALVKRRSRIARLLSSRGTGSNAHGRPIGRSRGRRAPVGQS